MSSLFPETEQRRRTPRVTIPVGAYFCGIPVRGYDIQLKFWAGTNCTLFILFIYLFAKGKKQSGPILSHPFQDFAAFPSAWPYKIKQSRNWFSQNLLFFFPMVLFNQITFSYSITQGKDKCREWENLGRLTEPTVLWQGLCWLETLI